MYHRVLGTRREVLLPSIWSEGVVFVQSGDWLCAPCLCPRTSYTAGLCVLSRQTEVWLLHRLYRSPVQTLSRLSQAASAARAVLEQSRSPSFYRCIPRSGRAIPPLHCIEDRGYLQVDGTPRDTMRTGVSALAACV